MGLGVVDAVAPVGGLVGSKTGRLVGCNTVTGGFVGLGVVDTGGMVCTTGVDTGALVPSIGVSVESGGTVAFDPASVGAFDPGCRAQKDDNPSHIAYPTHLVSCVTEQLVVSS